MRISYEFLFCEFDISSNKPYFQSFSSFERPTVAQIDHILADRDRLIRRTRVRRTKYRVLGNSEDKTNKQVKSKMYISSK